MRSFFLIAVLMPALASCTLSGRPSKEVSLTDLRTPIPDHLDREGSAEFLDGSIQGTIRRHVFDTGSQAKSYMMERRLLILRKFETLIEPYFGTMNAEECSGNLQADFLKIEEDGLRALLRLPTLGPRRTIHDCLEENNSDWALIEFLVCGNRAYDLRIYRPLKEGPFAYRPQLKCMDRQ